jgi:hypothetical protein
MAQGENDSTWGGKANTVFQMLEAAIGGVVTLNNPSGTITLSNSNYTNDQSKKCFIYLTGTLGSNVTIVTPATMTKNWRVIYLAASGGFTCALQPSGGTSRTVPQGCGTELFTDGLGGNYYVAPPVVLTTGAPNSLTGAVASSVGVTAAGNLSSTNAQSAFSELQGDIDTINASLASGVQPLNANLTALAAVSTAKGEIPVGTGDAAKWSGLAVGGTDGMVLAVKSAASTGMAFASLVPSGTVALFYQAAAPTGWTGSDADNDKAIRIRSAVSATGGTAGGTTAFSSIFAARTIARTDLPNVAPTVTINDNHYHQYNGLTGVTGASQNANDIFVTTGTGTTQNTTTKVGSITATCQSLNGGVTQTQMDFAVQYINVIKAAKAAY